MIGKLPLIEHAHDVRMVELSQRLRLEAPVARYFQGHDPLHRELPGQKHRGKRALAHGIEQIEIVDPLARRDRRDRLGGHQRGRQLRLLQAQQPRQFDRLLGEPLIVFAGRDVTESTADVILLINHVARQATVVGQLGKFAHVIFDQLRPAPLLPAIFQVDFDRLDQRQAAQRAADLRAKIRRAAAARWPPARQRRRHRAAGTIASKRARFRCGRDGLRQTASTPGSSQQCGRR